MTAQPRRTTNLKPLMNNSLRVSEVQTRIEASYFPVQYAFVQFFTEHLVDLVDSFEGDLTQMLVLAVLGQRRLESQFDGHDESQCGKACMSASRIADVLHLPRQTVNRKLAALKAKGWIDNHPQKGWYIVGDTTSAPAKEAFSDFEKRFNRRLARLYIQLRQELQG
jgi:biotin operon repressor